MPSLQFLGALQDDIIESIKQKMIDPKAQNQIGRFRTALTQKANELRLLNERNRFIATKQSQYLSMMNDILGPSSDYGAVTISQNAEAQQKKVIKDLFLLIHKILDYLSSGQTATTEYVIYYNTDDQRETGTFIRREVSAKKLYKSDAITVTPSGIILPRNKLSQLFGSLKSLEAQTGKFSVHSTSGAYQKLADQAIEAMTKIFYEMDNALEGYTEKMKKEHLGRKKWEQYLYYRNIAKWGSRAQATYNRYMLTSQYGELSRAAYNRGHIGEAYENYLQTGRTDWGALFQESTNNTPWYAKGDVNTTQVKTLFTNSIVRRANESMEDFVKRQQRASNPSVQIASMESILGLTNELLLLLNMRATGNNYIKQKIKMQIDTEFEQNRVEEKMKKTVDALAERKVLQLFKDTMKK